MTARRPPRVELWPDWYLCDVLRALSAYDAELMSDEQLLRLWHAYCAAAPAAEVDA